MLLFLQLMPTLSRIDYMVVLHGVIQPDKQCPAGHASNACISYFVMSTNSWRPLRRLTSVQNEQH